MQIANRIPKSTSMMKMRHLKERQTASQEQQLSHKLRNCFKPEPIRLTYKMKNDNSWQKEELRPI